MLADTVIEAVGAGATLVAVFYARSTVVKSNEAAAKFDQAQKDTQRHHDEAMSAERAAATDDRQARYEAKLERASAFQAEMVLRRIAQAEKIADILLELVNVASGEHKVPAPILTSEDGTQRATTRTMAVCARLRIAVSTLVGIGGPDLRDRVPRASNGQPDDSLRLWTDAMSLLVVVDLLLPDGDPRFMLEAPITGVIEPPETTAH